MATVEPEPIVLTDEDSIAAALVTTYGISEEEARRQARATLGYREPDILGFEPEPYDWSQHFRD